MTTFSSTNTLPTSRVAYTQACRGSYRRHHHIPCKTSVPLGLNCTELHFQANGITQEQPVAQGYIPPRLSVPLTTQFPYVNIVIILASTIQQDGLLQKGNGYSLKDKIKPKRTKPSTGMERS
ncbi:hypothetical protein Tco_1559106 [Tanacetum coccineum]